MSVNINFNAILPSGSSLVNLTQNPASGLGFFGSGGFGTSVPVGLYQSTTYICNLGGTASGAKLNNTSYLSALSGTINGTGYDLNAIPNKFATLNISLTGQLCNVRNVQLYVWDNSVTTNSPSGVTTQLIELCNPTGILDNTKQVGSGYASWQSLAPGAYYRLANNPGLSGTIANNSGLDGGTATGAATQHDWFVCLSAMPTTIGSKSAYGLYVQLEYM